MNKIIAVCLLLASVSAYVQSYNYAEIDNRLYEVQKSLEALAVK